MPKYYWNRYRSTIGEQDPSQPPDPALRPLLLLMDTDKPFSGAVPDALGEWVAAALSAYNVPPPVIIEDTGSHSAPVPVVEHAAQALTYAERLQQAEEIRKEASAHALQQEMAKLHGLNV